MFLKWEFISLSGSCHTLQRKTRSPGDTFPLKYRRNDEFLLISLEQCFKKAHLNTWYVRFKVGPPFFEVKLVILVHISCLESFLNVNNFFTFEGKSIQHLLISLLEVKKKFSHISAICLIVKQRIQDTSLKCNPRGIALRRLSFQTKSAMCWAEDSFTHKTFEMFN